MTPEEIMSTAARLEAQLKLANIRLIQADLQASAPPLRGRVNVQMGIEVKATQTDKRIDMHVAYVIAAHLTSEEGNEEDPCWEIKTTYAVDYIAPDGATFSNAELEILGAVSSTLTVHPYARTFVHLMTTQMGYPSFGLQLLTARELAELSAFEELTEA